ncbi:MAG: hypothetical protein U0R26_10185 [Solirubrobacterales bacterium]
MGLAKTIPLAFVMIAGPQILSAIFLATTENWRRNSVAFVVGAGLSVLPIATLALLLGTGASDQGADHSCDVEHRDFGAAAGRWSAHLPHAQDIEAAEMDGQAGGGDTQDGISPRLLAPRRLPDRHPHVDRRRRDARAGGRTVVGGAAVVAVVLLFVSSPALLLLLMGERGEKLLPKIRDWMNANSWIISEIVIGLFVLTTLNSLAG